MLKPKFTKYTKRQKGRLNTAVKVDQLFFGSYGLRADQPAIINSSHLSAALFTLKRVLKKEGQPIIRIFPHTPVTKKPSEVRMGKGKGSVSHFIAKVQTGSILFEIKGEGSGFYSKAIAALRVAKMKLPLSSSIIVGCVPPSL